MSSVIFFVGYAPCARVQGHRPQEKHLCLEKRVTYFSTSENMSHVLGGFSAHGFFVDGFLFPVK
jgi:hypothetical protein